MDAIVVGSGTARADDPLLTARPAGPRTALRVVVDGAASLSPRSKLVQTAREVPVLVAVARDADVEARIKLENAGCEVLVCEGPNRVGRLEWLLDELGRRRLTNVLVEGGGKLLGNLFDIAEIDEVHAFVGAKLVGGAAAPGPVAGNGAERLRDALRLSAVESQQLGDDVVIRGRVDHGRGPAGQR
jgi:diaminohydroxyphosphoribosylaminopyrimidine deaminase/5-amino-6-(5-phosphoribosylamino)uracil reductase